MPLTLRMVASEVLMCGLKKAPLGVGTAFEVVDALRASHAKTVVDDRLADIEAQLTRWEKRQRDLVAEEIQTILGNLARPGIDGASLTEEIRNLRQIQEQGWNPSLFEGLMLNSTHLAELKRNPHHYGRILDDRDPVDPARGIHILLDADKTRVLELTPFAFSQLLANQARGVPDARMQLGDGIWAFPTARVDPEPAPAKARIEPVAPPPRKAPPFPDLITTKTADIPLKLIPAGSFLMGSPEGEGNDSERPQHKVTISQPFYLGIHPVTQAQYAKLMGKNPSHFAATGVGKDKVAGMDTSRFPVERVSWYDSVQFCNALSQAEGLKPYYKIQGERVEIVGGDGYRLPSEAEWEYACRAGPGGTGAYGFGDDAGQLGQYAWFHENSDGRTHIVGEARANKFGLHDMHGNVWEWTWDHYEADYYLRSPGVDPVGPSQAAHRVFRGGCWSCNPRYCRSADRSWGTPGFRNYGLGFRVARVRPGP